MMVIHSVYGGGAAAGAGSQADPLSVTWSQLDPMYGDYPTRCSLGVFHVRHKTYSCCVRR